MNGFFIEASLRLLGLEQFRLFLMVGDGHEMPDRSRDHAYIQRNKRWCCTVGRTKGRFVVACMEALVHDAIHISHGCVVALSPQTLQPRLDTFSIVFCGWSSHNNQCFSRFWRSQPKLRTHCTFVVVKNTIIIRIIEDWVVGYTATHLCPNNPNPVTLVKNM